MKIGSKYYPLYAALRECEQDEKSYTFEEIERLLDATLPPSARTKYSWWSNRRTGNTPSMAWIDAGYDVLDVDLVRQEVLFRRTNIVYQVRRVGSTIIWDAELIRLLRSHMDVSQAELADHMGVRQQTISEWETGMYEPRRAMNKYLTILAEQAGFVYGEK